MEQLHNLFSGERAERGRFQVVGDDPCAVHERAEKYTLRPAIGRAVRVRQKISWNLGQKAILTCASKIIFFPPLVHNILYPTEKSDVGSC